MQKRIVFEYRPDSLEASTMETEYHCTEVTNSIVPVPGTWYARKMVDDLIEDDWVVVIRL